MRALERRPAVSRSLRRAMMLLASMPLAPMPAAAQGLRVAIEPQVSGVGGNALWGPSTHRSEEPTLNGRLVLARTTEVARDPMALLGGRLTFSPGGSRWHVLVEGGGGRTRLRFAQRERNRLVGSDGQVFLIGGTSLAYTQHAMLLQLGVRAAHAGRWRRWATELSGGLMAQRVRTRADSALMSTPMSPPVRVRVEGNTYTDPAAVLGAAIGPSSGALSGLRIALRSTHAFRSPDMVNDFARSGYSTLDAKGREWQWQPEASLGWQVWFGR